MDRARWRSQRKQMRRREVEQDQRDAERELEETERLKRESEQFLAKQADFLTSMTSSSLRPDAEPTKLKLVSTIPAEVKTEERAKPKAPAVFAGGDDEDDGDKKRKRELIPLSYSDDEDEDTKAEQKQAKIKRLVSSIPTDKRSLWSHDVQWQHLSEVRGLRSWNAAPTDGHSRKWRRRSYGLSWPKNALSTLDLKKMKSSALFLTTCVLTRVLRTWLTSSNLYGLNILLACKGTDIGLLTQVLADEAEEFVIKVYRHLHFELLSKMHGIQL